MLDKDNQNNTLAEEIINEIKNAKTIKEIKTALLEGMYDAAPEEEEKIKNNNSILKSVDQTAQKIWNSKEQFAKNENTSKYLESIGKETEKLFKNTGNKLNSSKLLNIAKAIGYAIAGIIVAALSVQQEHEGYKKTGKAAKSLVEGEFVKTAKKGFKAKENFEVSEALEEGAETLFERAKEAWQNKDKRQSFIKKLKTQRKRRGSGKGKV